MAGLFDSIGSIFGGLTSKDPYKDAMKQYQKYANQAAGYQNPFYNAGKGAIGDYQNYLKGMSDPSEFINNLMGGYSESPYAKHMQDQSMRAAQNMGSASGLSGSTPLTQFAQENAGNIASGDMNQWLQNVLGINNQYGGGLEKLMGIGQNSANSLSNIFGNLGNNMGGAAAGSTNFNNKKMSDIFSGLFGLAGNMSGMGSFGGSGGNDMGGMEKYLPLIMGML